MIIDVRRGISHAQIFYIGAGKDEPAEAVKELVRICVDNDAWIAKVHPAVSCLSCRLRERCTEARKLQNGTPLAEVADEFNEAKRQRRRLSQTTPEAEAAVASQQAPAESS